MYVPLLMLYLVYALIQFLHYFVVTQACLWNFITIGLYTFMVHQPVCNKIDKLIETIKTHFKSNTKDKLIR